MVFITFTSVLKYIWCCCAVFRSEAICLHHVWHEVYTTLPTGETQSHSYRYASLFKSCPPLTLTFPLHVPTNNVYMAASNSSLCCFLSLFWQMLICHDLPVRIFCKNLCSNISPILCIWNDMMTIKWKLSTTLVSSVYLSHNYVYFFFNLTIIVVTLFDTSAEIGSNALL